MTRLRLLPACAMVAFLAGCGSSHGGTPAPTPTPTPSMIVQPVITISGTTAIQHGECVGFRIQTANFVIPPTARVSFGPYDLSPSFFLVLDSNTVEVGFPCFYTGLDLPLGPLDVAVIDGAQAVVGVGAFTVADTTRIDVGAAPADSWTATDPDANSLGFAHDFDVYDWSAPSPGLYLSEAVVDSGALASFKPYEFVTGVGSAAGSSWGGSEAVLIPAVTGSYATEIADDTVGGANSGFGYHFRVSPLGTPAAIAAPDTCSAASITTAGLYTIDLATAAADFDPAGSASCVDRHAPTPPVAGDGVRAQGKDRALKVLVPAGSTLLATARGATTDVVLYLVADSGSPCSAVSVCLAAADVFGASDSETLIWKNTGGTDQTAWLIVDDHGDALSTPADVTLLLRYTP